MNEMLTRVISDSIIIYEGNDSIIIYLLQGKDSIMIYEGKQSDYIFRSLIQQQSAAGIGPIYTR